MRIAASGSRYWMLAVASLFVFVMFVCPQLQAQTFSVVHDFTGGTDGGNPLAGLVMDASGNFYGTTSTGGEYGAGTVFEYSAAGVQSVLYNFTGDADGGTPEASLLLIGGALYGTAGSGGAFGHGAVFEVSTAGKETVLYSFAGGTADGSEPGAALTHDASGNFYGTTFYGGTDDNGTVFELLRPKSGSASWTEKVLYSFGTGDDGANPVSGVSFDTAGNLYGTTSTQGQFGYGTVYQLKLSGSAWTENILHQFALLNDGGIPYAGIVVDRSGNLWGATTDGGQGGSNGGGTIFEMVPSNGSWTFDVIYSLPGWGVSGSFRNLLVVSPTKIYATTHCDGASTAGTVFALTNVKGVWEYTSLYVFTGGSDGMYSFSNPVLDRSANLWGTTKQGGTFGNGVLFKIHL
jgi:uncharacterized repeat protein (TIGR03803 family)